MRSVNTCSSFISLCLIQLGNGHYFATREKDSMGRRVIVNMASRFDVGRHTYLDQMRAISITLETLLAIDDEAQVSLHLSNMVSRGGGQGGAERALSIFSGTNKCAFPTNAQTRFVSAVFDDVWNLCA